MNSRRSPWPYQTKLVICLLVLALFVYLLFRFSIIIPPLILAVILAYILSPLSELINRRFHLPRVVAIFLAYLTFIVLVGFIPALVLPVLVTEIKETGLSLQTILANAQQLVARPLYFAGNPVDISGLLEQTSQAFRGLGEAFISQTLELVVNFVSSIVWLIFILVFSFYLIKDGEKLQTWLENAIPPVYLPDFIRLRSQINEIWSAFFRGQIVLAVVVAALFTVIGLILGLPFAIGMGVLAGLLEFLPSVGHGIWLVIASGLAIFIGSTWIPLPNWVFTLIMISLHLIFQQFDLNYLIPRVIGRRVHLPPIVVIFGIVSGAVLAGILGIPLAAPTIASGRVIGRYIYNNIFDLDPFPELEEPPVLSAKSQWWQITKKGQSTK